LTSPSYSPPCGMYVFEGDLHVLSTGGACSPHKAARRRSLGLPLHCTPPPFLCTYPFVVPIVLAARSTVGHSRPPPPIPRPVPIPCPCPRPPPPLRPPLPYAPYPSHAPRGGHLPSARIASVRRPRPCRVLISRMLPCLASPIACGCEQEDDYSPDPNVMAWRTPADYQAFLNTHFASWAPEVAPTLFTLVSALSPSPSPPPPLFDTSLHLRCCTIAPPLPTPATMLSSQYQNVADASPPQAFYGAVSTQPCCHVCCLGRAGAAYFRSPLSPPPSLHPPLPPSPAPSPPPLEPLLCLPRP
jgi:hypothetical protein